MTTLTDTTKQLAIATKQLAIAIDENRRLRTEYAARRHAKHWGGAAKLCGAVHDFKVSMSLPVLRCACGSEATEHREAAYDNATVIRCDKTRVQLWRGF